MEGRCVVVNFFLGIGVGVVLDTQGFRYEWEIR